MKANQVLSVEPEAPEPRPFVRASRAALRVVVAALTARGVLMAHSILGRMAADGSPTPGPAFARRVDCGLSSDELTHDLFGAHPRVDEFAGAEGDRRLAFGPAYRRGNQGRTGRFSASHEGLRIVSGNAQTLRYDSALALAGIGFERGVPDAARGLWRIARQAGLI
jgi:hypothetical protein